MNSRNAVFFFVVDFGAYAGSPNACAQDNPSASSASPLSVTTEFSSDLGADCSGASLIARLDYAGTKALRGYVVKVAFADTATGGILSQQTLREIRDLKEPLIASGAEWTRTVCISRRIAEDRSKVTVSVDVLKFADGSIWGPAALRESHQLIGTLDGMDFLAKTTELERFVSPILPERGPLPVQNIQSKTIGPLKIQSGVWLDECGKEMVAVEVTNEGSTPIRGYLLTTSFFDPATGTRIRRVSTKELETHGNPSDYLAPGSSWVAAPRKFSYLSDGTLASYEITLDLVVFADGSTFGPKKSQESDEVLGMFQGIDRARNTSQNASANREVAIEK